jgi:hypothetical protein
MRAEWRAVGRIDTQIPGNEETVSKILEYAKSVARFALLLGVQGRRRMSAFGGQ